MSKKKKRKKSSEDLRTKVRRLMASSEQVQEDFPTRIQLNIGGDDTIKESVLTCLKEELECLGDIIVTDDNPRYRIFVVGMDAPEPIFAVVITDTLGMEGGSPHGTVLKSLLSERLDEEEMDAVARIAAKHDLICSVWVMRAPSGDLFHLCEDLVERFEGEILEPDRKLRPDLSEH